MKIAVVTPVYQTEKPWLEQCLTSVRTQTIPCTHFLVNDGDESLHKGHFPGVEFLQLPRPHKDFGNTPRAIGSVSAIAQDFDALAYLDADNWFEPDHLQQLVELHECSGAAVCTAARNLVDLEGQILGRCPEVDGEKFADTNSLFFTRAAFGLVAIWYRMPHAHAFLGDRVVWKAIIDERISHAHNSIATVNYRTRFLAHYTYFGKPPPAGAKYFHPTTAATGEFVSAEIVIENPSPSQTDPTLPKPGATVSVCMIVKNEETNLDACLTSLADLFDEIIVVDTGSTDQTKECARRNGAKVFDFVWEDSFAAARNESLRHAKGDWIFWLDADEHLDETNLQKLRHLLAHLPQENNAYLMRQGSALDQVTGAHFVVDQVRLFRNSPQVHWRYRVHEQIHLSLLNQGAKDIRTDIVIGHRGFQEPEMRMRKRERNLLLLQMEIKENPCDPFILFNLANTSVDEGRMEEAISFSHRCLQYAPANASFIPKVYFLLAGSYLLLGHIEESLRYCRAGKQLFPDALDLWFHEGLILLNQGDLAGARHCFETILATPPQRHYFGVNGQTTDCRTRHNLAIIYRRLGLPHKAEEKWLSAIERTPHFEAAWLGLLELYLEQKRQIKVQSLLKRLEDKDYRDAILPALQARLLLARAKILQARRILEEALVRYPKSLWMRMFLADILLRSANDVDAAEQHLRTILKLSPNDYNCRQKLEQLLAKRKRQRINPKPKRKRKNPFESKIESNGNDPC